MGTARVGVRATARIRVSPERRIHILDGDATGGGHGPGRSVPGKTEFPNTLTDDEIIDGIEGIANDPNCYPGGVISRGGKEVIIGKIKGVDTQVVVSPRRRQVITGYPINVPPNK